MNAGPPPPRPDDKASDPLLAALRQRLGDYGQAPPPGAWSAIKKQLPPPLAPRSRWRSRRLLPLLLLLLGLLGTGTVAVLRGQLARRSQVANASRAHLLRSTKPTAAAPSLPREIRQTPALTRSAPTLATHSTSAPSTHPARRSSPNSAVDLAATKHFDKIVAPRASLGSIPTTRAKFIGKNHSTASVKQPLATQSTSNAHRRRALEQPALAPASQRRQRSLASLAGLPGKRVARARQLTKERPARTYATPASSVAGRLATAASHIEGSNALANRRATTSRNFKNHRTSLATAFSLASRRASAVATTASSGDAQMSLTANSTSLFEANSPNGLPSQVDSLALRAAALGLPLASPLPALAAQPDSAHPSLPRARRWSVLVLAGPTLSYRTLGPAPTLAAQHPDFARLERPALGLGAQVQVRRVLSGRWALALGLGYQEYATRLALSVIDSSNRSPRSVHQRDIYRLLTVPAQLSYTFGSPRGRLSQALLLGIEPGWYLGGRSTEGSNCGCQQQVYPVDSARTSPYRSLTLALSLGLDLRYRLGGPASRWQWVVQPTARYIITPFVRREAVGFTPRQPWSLGLLTGISWNLP